MAALAWNIRNHQKITSLNAMKTVLLQQRGLTTDSAVDEYFSLTLDRVDCNLPDMQKALHRIRKAITDGEKIVVYSDYDADGICGVALLWRSLHRLGAHTLPFVPHREIDGYGLNPTVVSDLASDETKLIITVDCGITSASGVEEANKHGVDVIITDHHTVPSTLPSAFAILHDTRVCGTGVAWKLSRALLGEEAAEFLDLVAIATIADMVPLSGENRILATLGLKALRSTKNIGIHALLQDAGVPTTEVDTFHIGFILAPRINALGRLSHALPALRLLCTGDRLRARQLARDLSEANAARRTLTEQTLTHAFQLLEDNKQDRLIFLGHETWHQGIIGLIAGRFAETFFKPTIIYSQGKERTKASCRSIPSFNIIEALRQCEDILVDVGGHPMAAGFTIENKLLPVFARRIREIAKKTILPKDFVRMLEVEGEISPELCRIETAEMLKTFAPFGVGNPEPVFCSRRVKLNDVRLVGTEQNHLKLSLTDSPELSIIGFKKGFFARTLRPGDVVDLAYTMEKDTWGGGERVTLKLKDVRKVA
ncbi:MAG: single-stranded-DNA-specific exonuclease RecJ [bacterium]|nr:single-stranded-DNA-specific exonuclease RecJ [bacterium]